MIFFKKMQVFLEPLSGGWVYHYQKLIASMLSSCPVLLLDETGIEKRNKGFV
jgi:hypothetical protein